MSNKHKRYISLWLIPFCFSAEFFWAFISIALGIPFLVYGICNIAGILAVNYLTSGIH